MLNVKFTMRGNDRVGFIGFAQDTRTFFRSQAPSQLQYAAVLHE